MNTTSKELLSMLGMMVVLTMGFFLYYAHDKVPIVNFTGVTYYKENLHNSCHAIVTEPSIVVRIDDIQDFRPQIKEMVTQAQLRNISLTLGVIPGRIGHEKASDDYFRELAKNKDIEIAQHGTNHTTADINASEEMIAWGYNKIVLTLGAVPVSYIPPYNKITPELLEILSKHFKVDSQTGGTFKSGDIAVVSQDIETYDYEGLFSTHAGPTTIAEIVEACEKAINTKNLCVITFHPQELSTNIENATDTNEVNLQRYELELDALQKIGAQFIKLSDTTRCTQ